jgi:FkbM family methyltransferase
MLLDRLKRMARETIKTCGFELVRYNYLRSGRLRRIKILSDLGTQLVLDAGANAGQYALALRRDGFQGDIWSFEPLPELRDSLQRLARYDPLWTIHGVALGDCDGEIQINACSNTQVSSILVATGAFATSEWKHTVGVTVPIRRLDSIVQTTSTFGRAVHLKIDVQGYERQVLQGAQRVLDSITSIELEMSTVPLYAHETLLPELIALLDQLGFRLASIDLAHVDCRSGHVLQIDGLFVRQSV